MTKLVDTLDEENAFAYRTLSRLDCLNLIQLIIMFSLFQKNSIPILLLLF